MTPSFKGMPRILPVLLCIVYLYLFLLLRPRIIRCSDDLTIIDSRIDEIDINHPRGFRTTDRYQDIERDISVRLLVLPW